MQIRRVVAVVLTLAWLVPSAPANAQVIPRSFDILSRAEPPGRWVRLFDTSGRQTIGRIAEISTTAIVLEVKDDRAFRRVTFAEADVRQISAKRSHWEGPLTGLAAGILIATQLCRRDRQCGNQSRTRVSPVHVSGPLMLASLAGGPAIGHLLDRPGTEPILYRAPERERSSDSDAPRR